MMRAVKSKGGKQNLGLTVSKATRQARTIVDQVMPGVMATVESKPSWDLATDVETVTTTITFPASTDDVTRISLLAGLGADDGRTMRIADSSIVITRKVK